MKRLSTFLALGAVALLALSGIAAAKDRSGDDHGHHHGRHHHHHRELQMREAGTISSFDTTTGKLTIALSGGESVSGLVTQGTEIRCEGIDQRRDHGGDDNSGPGGGGDDHGGRGDEPGDDNGNGGQFEPGDDNGGETPAGAPTPGAASCSTASLVPGAVVGEAELRLEGGAAVFEEIELGLDS